MKKQVRASVVLLVSLVGVPSIAWAQASSATGRVRGVVTDQSGAVLQGATVAIDSVDSRRTRSAFTDREGQYVFDAMPFGTYEISAAFAGFETSVRTSTIAAAQPDAVVDFSLNLSKTQSVVMVSAPAMTTGVADFVPERPGVNDTALLLEGMPGVSLSASGGVSSLPAIHGMADDRVNVVVNGMSISSACSNHMNPPLSYIAPASVGRISVMAGITPVSRGGDSIGGSIAVDPPRPEFARSGNGLLTHGTISVMHRTGAFATNGRASASVATENLRIAYNGSYVDAGNYRSGAGVRVKSTFYEAANHAVQLAGRRQHSLTTIDLSVQSIPQQGFVNARMDMTGNHAKSANVSHDGEFEWGTLTARGYYVNTRHDMNILRDKIPGMNMPMHTNGTNVGLSANADVSLSPRNTLRIGHEFSRFRLDDWWPPVSVSVGSMGPETLWNVRDGRRDRFGTYAEWEARRGGRWTTLAGVRSDVVRMNTGGVSGYNMSATTTGSAAYYADATAFNARDRKRVDKNIDLTATAKYDRGSIGSYAIGYARKTRSPNVYERYLWVKRSSMSMRMNGWFGDANGYTGNIDLRPEVASTLSATAGWHGRARAWELTLTPYYTSVHDFIDVNRCPVVAGGNGCTAANLVAGTGFVNLQFTNHDARLYGIDGSGRVPMGGNAKWGSVDLSGMLGYVRGTDRDAGGNLYHMMPLTAKVTLEHHRGAWAGAIDLQTVAAKQEVQSVRNELRTAGYALANVRGSYQWPYFQIDAGIDNLMNRQYDLPLGGRYWIGDKTGASSVPGIGRSIFGGLTVKF